MSGGRGPVVLLGPQGDEPDVGRVVAEVAPGARVALVSAGWREWEDDDRPVTGALPGSVNLALWGRAERVWAEDPELTEGHRAAQRRVRALRRAYNLRLAPAMEAWIDLLAADGDPAVLDPERADALEAVRALDRRHAARLTDFRREFREAYGPHARASVARERTALAEVLDGVGVVVVEGGHVPVLLNRLRLFGLAEMLAGRTVVACSGGAMALAGRVVLFHDTPPWGPGHAEVGEVGLGLVPGVVPLANGSARLRLDDRARVRRFALRLAPDAAVLLDPGTRLEWRDGWRPGDARRLSESGGVEGWRGAA